MVCAIHVSLTCAVEKVVNVFLKPFQCGSLYEPPRYTTNNDSFCAVLVGIVAGKVLGLVAGATPLRWPSRIVCASQRPESISQPVHYSPFHQFPPVADG